MSKSDKVLIIVIVVVSLLGYAIIRLQNRDEASLIAEISVDGRIVSQVNLNQPPSGNLIYISGPLGKSTAEVKAGAIRMKFSPCPDHYCMQTGWINRPGQAIVCVPNHIVIKISPDDSFPDTISS